MADGLAGVDGLDPAEGSAGFAGSEGAAEASAATGWTQLGVPVPADAAQPPDEQGKEPSHRAFSNPDPGEGGREKTTFAGTNPDTLSTHERQCDPRGYFSRAVTVPYRSDMMA